MLENSLASPVSSAMQSVGRLHSLLTGTKQGPSAKLLETLRYHEKTHKRRVYLEWGFDFCNPPWGNAGIAEA